MALGWISARGRALLLTGAVLAGPALAAASADIAALAGLERGRWEVRDLDSGETRPALCLGDPAQLIQLEHAGASCPSEVVASASGAATVQYSCSGRGFGHTHVRVETPRLIRIETQGLNNGRPFSRRFEAKRAGRC
ncbi:hypothetical protein E2493_12665 [Sphingomonas parva]|uniref:DUF3617 family protein n=1 Tax=Sphingomonas parva TaxID=2555898 RepID=A0A4Y8ZP98_9SPHN|nr:hypothetical protein [Sphingomonas parva]TFI57841.1 hypothetical protein E2493_12665 [Sphingomonas parva]